MWGTDPTATTGREWLAYPGLSLTHCGFIARGRKPLEERARHAENGIDEPTPLRGERSLGVAPRAYQGLSPPGYGPTPLRGEGEPGNVAAVSYNRVGQPTKSAQPTSTGFDGGLRVEDDAEFYELRGAGAVGS